MKGEHLFVISFRWNVFVVFFFFSNHRFPSNNKKRLRCCEGWFRRCNLLKYVIRLFRSSNTSHWYVCVNDDISNKSSDILRSIYIHIDIYSSSKHLRTISTTVKTLSLSHKFRNSKKKKHTHKFGSFFIAILICQQSTNRLKNPTKQSHGRWNIQKWKRARQNSERIEYITNGTTKYCWKYFTIGIGFERAQVSFSFTNSTHITSMHNKK